MEKLSPKKYSIISKLSSFFEENNIKFSLDRNNFEINNEVDYNLFKEKLEKMLWELQFDELKIDEIKFFNKVIIIITIKNFDKEEEHIKIFYNKSLQYYKNQLSKLFGIK